MNKKPFNLWVTMGTHGFVSAWQQMSRIRTLCYPITQYCNILPSLQPTQVGVRPVEKCIFQRNCSGIIETHMDVGPIPKLQTESSWIKTLHWRHNDHDGVSNHQPHGCLLNRLFRRRSKKTSKLRVTGLCAGNSPGTDEFPAQMASNAESAFIWWRHHEDWCYNPCLAWLVTVWRSGC